MPTVDVVIPAYNSGSFLPVALDSVIGQSFEDWRILLIDDGSTDLTAEIAARYAARLGPKMKYIYQGNAGVSAARNRALREADAEFIALLDGDDVWLPCRLKESLKLFAARPTVGLTYGFIDAIDAQGRVVTTYNTPNKIPEGRVAPRIYKKLMDLPCPSITFRKRCIDEVGMFDETMRATEDRDLWLRIALKYEVGLVRTVIAQYRSSPQSLTRNSELMLKAQLGFIEKHAGAPGCGFWARRVALGQVHRQRAENLAERGQISEALRMALRALTFNPFQISNARTSLSLLRRGALTALSA